MKKNLLLLTLLAFDFYPVFCQTLYTSTAFTGNTYNPGLGASGTPVVVFDDVLIPSSLVAGTDSIKITKLKFGIARFASAPAITVTFYYTVLDDTATILSNAIRIPPVALGSIDLPANGATDGAIVLTLGDSVNTLFKVKTDTGNAFPGYQTIFLGLSFSTDPNTQPLNDWLFTTPGAPASDNKNFIWLYDVDDALNPRSGGNFGPAPPNPSATFYLEVFGSGFKTLPITLAEFTARRSGNVNLLNWSTQQELNTRYFVIERSQDGRNYTGIGKVTAAGNSNIIRNYSFTDNNPAKGINYYRLRMIDKDNLVKLSAIRSIRNQGIADVNIYPIPATDKLTVAINADKATDGYLTITDVSGKIVYSRSVQLPQGNTILPVSVNNIAAGSYIMKIQLNDDIIVKKFSKQ